MERLLIKEKAFIDMFNDKIVPEPTGLEDDTKSIKKQYQPSALMRGGYARRTGDA